jgi:uncharacterized protein YgbK (DUF1537 family)
VPENTLLIGQADSPEKIRQWADAREATLLPVGGSEFFSALLESEFAGAAPAPTEEINFDDGKQLFICGTASKSVQTLVKSSRAAQVPVFGLPQELIWGKSFSQGARQVISERVTEAFEKARRIVLCVGLPQVRDVEAARRLAGNLVDIAELVLRRVAVKNIFAEGGATSAELVRRMKWPRLEVRREWATGVATLAVAGAGTQWLTIKPGSYSWPEQWTRGL